MRLKPGTKNDSQVNPNLSWSVVGNSNDEFKFPRKLLLTNTQVSRFSKTFANN